MNPSAPFRRLPLSLAKAVMWTAAALALTACDDRLAGTSVGTGNPTEIQVGFRDSSGAPVAVTGALKVYASTQIPVPGFAPDPLVSVDVAGATSASLKAEAFQALADSLWPKGSVDNGMYAFNVVVEGKTQGAILRGFAFRKEGAAFALQGQDGGTAVHGDVAEIKGILAPLVDIACSIDTAALSMNWDNYLFLYVTGYAAKGVKGAFVFHSIPATNHSVSFIPVPNKETSSGSIGDSLAIYQVKLEVGPGSVNPVQIGGVQSTVPTPASLKPK